MKIRTDFVTNSSSSNYCVSLGVKTFNEKIFDLNFCKSSEYDSVNVNIPLKESSETVVLKIQNCKSVEELKDFIIESIKLDRIFSGVAIKSEGMSNSEYLDMVEKAIENDDFAKKAYAGLLKQYRETISEFQSEMEKVTGFDMIESVSINEHFSGWGEGAPDIFGDFFEVIKKSGIECETIEDIDEYEVATFSGNITRTITFPEGKVEVSHNYKCN